MVKAVDVAGTEVTEPDVAEGLVDPLKVLRVGGYGFRFEIQLGVLGHVLFCEIGKAHIAVGGDPGQNLFLEQDRLPLQLLLDLPLRHPRFWYPRHILAEPLAGIVIALGDGNFITSPLFLNGCH